MKVSTKTSTRSLGSCTSHTCWLRTLHICLCFPVFPLHRIFMKTTRCLGLRNSFLPKISVLCLHGYLHFSLEAFLLNSVPWTFLNKFPSLSEDAIIQTKNPETTTKVRVKTDRSRQIESFLHLVRFVLLKLNLSKRVEFWKWFEWNSALSERCYIEE